MANRAVTQPVAELVSNAREYLTSIVQPAVATALESPGDAPKTLSAFILLYHMKDWAKKDGHVKEEEFWNECPFARAIAEIANGGKHSLVNNPRFANDPVVGGFKLCGYGRGGFGIGPYGLANIQVFCSTGDHPEQRWYSLATVLTAATDWWTKVF